MAALSLTAQATCGARGTRYTTGNHMGHEGQDVAIRQKNIKSFNAMNEDFVLEKSIFNNVFEKDIRRVFIYKKAERLAKAVHLVAPAFKDSMSLRSRIDAIAIGLVDAAILPPNAARSILSRELLALSSILAIARTGGVLSHMNAEIIAREAHFLLQEIAAYEEPRLSLEDIPTLSSIARSTLPQAQSKEIKGPPVRAKVDKGHSAAPSETSIKDRRDAVLSVIKDKGKVSIKDISTVVRGFSEKTIQRELAALVAEGVVKKEGERRWSTYSIIAS